MPLKPPDDKTPEKRRPGVRLQDAVTVSLVILLVCSIGISSALWYQNSRKAAADGARLMQREIGSRIEDRILQFLATPHKLNLANAGALTGLDLTDLPQGELEHLFLSEISVFETVSSVYAGSPQGGIIDAGREGAGGGLYVIETEGFRSGLFRKYSVDAAGNRNELLQTVPDFDARTRPWFQAAVARKGAVWSDIYVLFSGQGLAIAASLPVYDSQGNLQLVLSSDIFLSHIDEFMRTLSYGSTGLGFITDRAGYMVAASGDDSHAVSNPDGSPAGRSLALDSPSPMVHAAAQYIIETLGGFDSIDETYSGVFAVDGKRQLLQISRIRDEYGIDWLSVLVIPELDFLEGILASTRTTVVFLFAALALTIGAGILVVRQVTRPLGELTAASHALSRGQVVPVPHSRYVRELRDLSESFEMMSNHLNATLVSLQGEIDSRKQAQRTLQESEERLRMYIEKAPVAIFVADENGQYTDVNPEACRMTGYPRDELLQMSITELVAKEDVAGIRPLFERLKSEGTASGVVEVRRKDGSELWMQLDSVVLGPNRLVAFCADVTERLQVEESLRHQQKMESLGTLASGVAHEINNPLMGMMSFAELIGSRIEDDQARVYAEGILREGERIAHIIRTLLAFAREDSGTRHPADVRTIIVESLPLVHTALLRSHITLEKDLAEAVPEVDCAQQQLQQVVVNLIMNARDALDERYPGYDDDKILRISATTVEDDHTRWVRMTIEDHGIGMPVEQTSRSFDPFFTTKSRDERTGMGLTISYGIIQDHGGRIQIESEQGKGSRIHVDLPVRPSDEGDTPKKADLDAA
jgi:PAS domain S-box-containing protein